MLDKDKPVQGYVIYAEFQRAGATRQIFFTPDGYTTLGRFVPMRAHYRTVSEAWPRKQWKTTISSPKDIIFALDRAEAGEVEALTKLDTRWAEDRITPLVSGYLTQINTQAWEMVGSPLIVEASKQDMDDIHSYKTPTKIIYRINQSRIAAGFPAELF